jgi:polyhydroxyalkanoate synthesis regulator phasin
MNKPYNFFEFWTKDLKEQNTTPMQAYQDFFKQWMPQKEQTPELGSPEFFGQMLKSQMDIGKLWMDNVQSLFEQIAPKRKEASLFDQWSKMYGLWNNELGKPFVGKSQRNDVAETFSNIMTFSQNYMEMYKLWQPILEQLNMGKKPKKNAMQEFMSSISMDKYNEIVGAVFGSLTPKQSNNFLEQIGSFTQTLLQNINEQTGGGLEKIAQSFPDMLSQIQGSQYEALGKMQKGIAPFIKMIPDGKEKQLLELSIQMQDDYTFYYIKSNEMQTLVQQTAQKALEKVLKTLLEKVSKDPSQVISFEDFINTWMDTTEPMMIELYRSPAFGKLQAESLAVSTAIKSRFEKQLELLLEPLPIAPRSEIDELNAIIHELRGKLRNLERQLETKDPASETEAKPKVVATTKKRNTSAEEVKTTSKTRKTKS